MRGLTLISLIVFLNACQTVGHDSRALSPPANSDVFSPKQKAVNTYSVGFLTEDGAESFKKNNQILRELFGESGSIYIPTTYTFPSQNIANSLSLNKSPSKRKLQWRTLSAESVLSFVNSKNSALEEKQAASSAWDIANEMTLNIAQALAAENSSNSIPVIVEPDFYHQNAFVDSWHNSVESDPPTEHSAGAYYDIVLDQKKLWPGDSKPAWHLEDDKTQLVSAQKRIIDLVDNTNRVQIAHLDTGYNPSDPLLPAYFQEEHSSDFTGQNGCSITGNGSGQSLGDKHPSHGARTLSVLGGSTLKTAKHPNETLIIGGNPYAAIREYRIGKSVIHFRPKEMTKAIWCATENGVDVISISAGGFPSIAQRNAINDAYEKGIAIFAAAGNHYRLPILNVSSPKTVVFPARYSRVMGVSGATYDEASYAESPSFWSQFLLFSWEEHIAPWMLRGNNGPRSVMADNMISAYSPNITTSYAQNQDRVSLSLQGAGTSNATPQVAAAASLWLQQEYPAMKNDVADQPWKKAEAVYQALGSSANKEFPDYEIEKFGAGLLKAEELMKTSYSDMSRKLIKKPPSSIGYRWIADAIISTQPSQPIDIQILFNLDMLITEAAQVIYNDEAFEKLVETAANCLIDAKTVVDCSNKRKRLETVQLLLDMDNISEHLRQHLIKRREDLTG